MTNQQTADDLVEQTDPRCLLILVLDTSEALAGHGIAELNAALAVFRADLAIEMMALRRVEVALVTAGGEGGVRLVQPPVVAGRWEPPELTASGDAPLGEAIDRALALVFARVEAYRAHGIGHYRPWLVVVTAGGATDDPAPAAARAREAEARGALSFLSVAIERRGPWGLPPLTSRAPLRVTDGTIRQAFQWLAASQKRRLPDPLV